MKKQLICLHGGNTFKGQSEYVHFLKNGKVGADTFKPKKSWKSTLPDKLGPAFEVFAPQMPNRNNANYQDWKIWFERMTPFIHDGVILAGHSLGGIFLAKYLCENTYPKKIKAVILIAPPYNDAGLQESLGNFTLPKSFKKCTLQVSNMYLLFSKDDPVVPFTQLDKYTEKLPQAKRIIFNNKQHFNQESFPELVKLIKTL